MKKIELTFDDYGKLNCKTDNCNLAELLFASKHLEIMAMNTMAVKVSDEQRELKSIILSLKLLLTPFDEKYADIYETEGALKILPHALKILVDHYPDEE